MAFFAPERTSTDRFVLRSFLPGDGAAVNEATLSSYDHLRGRMPWAVREEHVEVTEERMRMFRARYLLNEDFVIGVFAPDGRVIGGTGFHLRHGPLAARQAEIGMWIRGTEAGTGLGTAVLTEMVRWGFTDWPWERLVWGCHIDNQASRRVAEKCGFALEGTFVGEYDAVTGGRRDGVQYALLKRDWTG